MKGIAWCWCGWTVTPGREHSGIRIICINSHPATSMIRLPLFDFSSPVKNAILAKTYIPTMAASDIKDELGMHALWAGGRVNIGENIGIKTVPGVYATEVDLVCHGGVCWIVSLRCAFTSTYSKFTTTDTERGVSEIDVCNSMMGGPS